MTVAQARAHLGAEGAALTDREVEELVSGYEFIADLMIEHRLIDENAAAVGPATKAPAVLRSAHQ